MMQLQNLRQEVIFQSTSLTAGATAGVSEKLDTRPKGKKYREVIINVITATVSATNDYPTTLKLQESDTTTTTDFVDIVAATGGTATSTSVGFVLPSTPTNTATNMQPYVTYHLDTRKRKRYIRAVIAPSTTQICAVYATLGECAESSVAQADYNSGLQVIV